MSIASNHSVEDRRKIWSYPKLDCMWAEYLLLEHGLLIGRNKQEGKSKDVLADHLLWLFMHMYTNHLESILLHFPICNAFSITSYSYFITDSISSSLYENPGVITTAPPDPLNLAARPWLRAIYPSQGKPGIVISYEGDYSIRWSCADWVPLLHQVPGHPK